MSNVDFEGQMLLTEKQAAKALTMSQRKLWTLREKGEIACVKSGRRVMYDPSDLRAWIDSNKVVPQPSLN